MNHGKEWCTAYIEPSCDIGCTLEYEYEKRPEFPKVIYIDVHTLSDLKDARRPGELFDRKPEFMDRKLYEKIIDEFAASGGELVYMGLHSEPFADEKILDYIKYASSRGLKLFFQTNMRGMNERILEEMINAGVDARFCISFDGIFEETYRKSTGGGMWESLQNIHHLKRKYDNICYIDALKQHFLPFEQDVLEFYWNFYGIPAVCREPDTWPGTAAGQEKGMLRVGMGCPDILNSITADVDGTVVLCPLDIHCACPLGNLAASSIKEIWESEALRRITADIYKTGSSGLKLLCDRCSKVSMEWE